LFQTEPILFLQSLASDWLTTLASVLTRAAYPDVLGALVLAVAFGVNFRAGLVLGQAVLWTELFTGLVKESLSLPRPSDVDSRVGLMVEGARNETRFVAAGGKGWFDLPDPRAIAAVRFGLNPSFGFPSSAVSTATAFWGGVAMTFRSSRLLGVAVAIIALTALSRLYLGRHFVADVAGGAVLGGAVLGSLRRSAVKPVWYFRSPFWPPFLAVLPLLAFMAVPHVDPGSAGGLSGLYAARMLVEGRGLPRDHAPLWHRMARVALAVALYVALAAVVGLVLRTVAIEADPGWAEYLGTAGCVFLVFWGGVRLSERLRLYRRAPGGVTRPGDRDRRGAVPRTG
jgi:membrane-associated phospholipid phosphatase